MYFYSQVRTGWLHGFDIQNIETKCYIEDVRYRKRNLNWRYVWFALLLFSNYACNDILLFTLLAKSPEDVKEAFEKLYVMVEVAKLFKKWIKDLVEVYAPEFVGWATVERWGSTRHFVTILYFLLLYRFKASWLKNLAYLYQYFFNTYQWHWHCCLNQLTLLNKPFQLSQQV